MLLDVIVISFIVALVRGGRLKEIPVFRRLYLIGISIGLQILSALIPPWGNVFISISYLSTLLFFLSNWEYEDIRIFMIGWFLNALVIWANFGKMPVDLEQARKGPWPLEPILNGYDYKHTLLTDQTHLSFLGDIIFVPFPIPRVISFGDLFIILGAFLLIQRIMNKPISLIQLREGKKYAAAEKN